MRELYTKAWFPYCNAMGISWEQFWDMNPRIINAHKEGFKLKRQEENAMLYLGGAYTKAALEATVGNMFKKKGKQPFEYPSTPYPLFGETYDTEQEQIEGSDNIMTEAEKKKRTERLFGMLRLMQANFELSKSANTRESE